MRLWVLVVCAACGNVNGSSPQIDATSIPDLDAPAGAVGDHRHYVIDHETIPTTAAQAQALGLDLDGDGTVDNQLGNAAVMANMFGFDIVGSNAAAIDRGGILMLVDFQSTDLVAATHAGVQTFAGTNPIPMACANANDTVCRHHLDGTGSFGVDPTVPRGTGLLGDVTAGVFTSQAGTLTVWIAPFGDVLRFDLLGARVQLTGANDNGVTSGIVAGGVTVDDVTTKFLPSVAKGMLTIVKRDCPAPNPPSCNCGVNTPGATLISVYDTNHDCVISPDELRANDIIKAQLAPDLTIDGMMAVSFGLGVTAVKASFTP